MTTLSDSCYLSSITINGFDPLPAKKGFFLFCSTYGNVNEKQYAKLRNVHREYVSSFE